MEKNLERIYGHSNCKLIIYYSVNLDNNNKEECKSSAQCDFFLSRMYANYCIARYSLYSLVHYANFINEHTK